MPTNLNRSTSSLIGSDRVQGTSVFDANAEKIGVIERVMIEKVSGRVSFAVLSFGGFLGIGDEHYPLPWPALKYNVELGGYQIMIPIEKLKAGPKYEAGAEWDWAAGTKSVGEYYGA
ncbi:PRC-barrel domain protein [Afipia felis]|uniref:PRC-barrel domain protein n=1 Tax=Afipia felis TaxID=1035 RepID=A0A090MNA5_AFIFE|nr:MULTISPECIES: PRC-barrel domain-containing protein [Afipia]EFI50748.1 PRC-barrel domain protein [Afipia sp. 1NLS2]MBE0703586.1 PRC-barrel domain-containing protein [Afipia sp.]RTL77810.1 MAG: PRC-barrel domain containing protein [Bradyrhizobiaceae bacterium]CEG08846.1 PRC-barrel domain protein [Afipia felis]